MSEIQQVGVDLASGPDSTGYWFDRINRPSMPRNMASCAVASTAAISASRKPMDIPYHAHSLTDAERTYNLEQALMPRPYNLWPCVEVYAPASAPII